MNAIRPFVLCHTQTYLKQMYLQSCILCNAFKQFFLTLRVIHKILSLSHNV